jgi:hypothetical protein
VGIGTVAKRPTFLCSARCLTSGTAAAFCSGLGADRRLRPLLGYCLFRLRLSLVAAPLRGAFANAAVCLVAELLRAAPRLGAALGAVVFLLAAGRLGRALAATAFFLAKGRFGLARRTGR